MTKEEKIKLFKESVLTDCGDCSKCIFEDDPANCRLYYAMNFVYEKAKQEVAKEIFEKLDSYLWYFPQKMEYVLQEDLYTALKEEFLESEDTQ